MFDVSGRCTISGSSARLLLNCKVVHMGWEFHPSVWCSWVLHYKISQLFATCRLAVGSARGRVMWQVSFLAIIWLLWKEKTLTCFEGQGSSSSTALLRKVRLIVASRVSIPSFKIFLSPLFQDVGKRLHSCWGLSLKASLDTIHLHWALSKLNFDAGAIGNLGLAGKGGEV